MANVLVAMSGGVDSSVAAGLLLEQGHEVVGVTLKLWGGDSDSGCCSVSDVEDARRVASQLGIRHSVFNFTDEFDEKVVSPYVLSHQLGSTPNPCIECNRSIKFDLLLERALRLGFDYLATGHYARLVGVEGSYRIARGVDEHKDQSYVLSVLGHEQIQRLMFPVGDYPKSKVREIAEGMGLRTARKPDSLEVCFITKSSGREAFLSERIAINKARVVDSSSSEEVDLDINFETVTIGQRKGVGTVGDARRRYVISKDPLTKSVTLGHERELLLGSQAIENLLSSSGEVQDLLGKEVEVQGAAHGSTVRCKIFEDRVEYQVPRRKVAPGQVLGFYDNDVVLGSAVVSG